VIPALSKTNKMDGAFEDNAAAEGGQTAEMMGNQGGDMPGMQDENEISAANLKYAEPLFPFFGEETVKKCFSKKWQDREEALTEIESQVRQKQTEDRMLQAGLNATSLALNDKN